MGRTKPSNHVSKVTQHDTVSQGTDRDWAENLLQRKPNIPFQDLSSKASIVSRQGVSKAKQKRAPSRQQRLRRERVKARADTVMDQLEVKIDRSSGKGRKIKNRKVTWDEMNEFLKNSDKKSLNEKNKANVDEGIRPADLSEMAQSGDPTKPNDAKSERPNPKGSDVDMLDLIL